MITVFFSVFFFYRKGDHVMALLGGEYKNFVISIHMHLKDIYV